MRHEALADKPPVAPEALADKPPVAQAPLRASLKRAWGWSMNLLATGIIIYASLTLGRQIVYWWGHDAEPVGRHHDVPRPGDLGQIDRPHLLEVGEMPLAMRRQEIEGDLQAAFAALRASCREAARRGGPLGQKPGPAEQRLLERLARSEPVEEGPGRQRIYQLDGPVPLVVATSEPPAGEAGRLPAEVADAERRVVSWGLAVRLSGTRWTLFTLEASGRSASPAAGLPPLPVPPGCRRSLALHAEQGETLLGFSGSAGLEACQGFYDRWFAEQGWRRPAEWREVGGGWHAGYEGPQGHKVDVQLSPGPAGGMKGILVCMAPPSAAVEK